MKKKNYSKSDKKHMACKNAPEMKQAKEEKSIMTEEIILETKTLEKQANWF